MKKSLLLIVFLLVVSSVFAQYKNEYGGSLGFTNYLGDIGGGKGPRHDYVRDLRWQQTRYTVNGYFRYKLNKNFSTRSQLSYIRISGDDKNSTNPARVGRNLSFKSDCFEAMQTIEWNFYNQTKMSPRTSIVSKGGKKRVDFRAFIFTGIGALYFNPRAELNGKNYNLRKLQTEGVSYSPITWTAPVGFGFAYTMNKVLRIGMDFSYRFTGSDFLDDVSGNYAVSYNDALASSKKTSKTNADTRNMLANRTYEIQAYLKDDNQGVAYNPALPAGKSYSVEIDSKDGKLKGSKRGGNYDTKTALPFAKVTEKDGYFMTNITVGYVIKGKNKYYKSKYRNIVNRRKVVKKKTRAKF